MHQLGALDGPLTGLPVGVRGQLKGLIAFVEKSIEPPPVPDAQPTYDPSGLGFAVQRAADSFQKAWAMRSQRSPMPSTSSRITLTCER